MLEQGEVLLTWQLLAVPVGPASFPILARRIGNHRKAYLDYEGPLSGDRGVVRRIDRGPVEIEKLTEDECVFRAEGQRLSGNFLLWRAGDADWTLEITG
jgi:hypothetical protein